MLQIHTHAHSALAAQTGTIWVLKKKKDNGQHIKKKMHESTVMF